MAISPEMLKESFNKEVTQFEEYFDQRLATLSLIGCSDVLCVDIPKGRGFSSKHFEILKARYKQAGWKDVEHVSDRDGDYLRFKS
jgi:hypothetical protein